MTRRKKTMAMYKCDPEKHPRCGSKGICQIECFLTVNPDFSTDGKELTEEEADQYEKEMRKKARAEGKKWKN